MQDKEVNGKKIEINKHAKKEKNKGEVAKQFNNLFVKNLPEGTDDQNLKEMFSEFGEVESAYVQRDEI